MATAPALDACHRAREAWQRTQDQLDIFSVLNAAPDPPLTLAGRSVEHAEPQTRGGPAHTTLTAASASRAGHSDGPSSGASACSLTNQGEA